MAVEPEAHRRAHEWLAEVYSRLGETSGTLATDSTGHGHTGLLSSPADQRTHTGGLANDTEGTIASARELHERIALPNLLVKIPGTAAGTTRGRGGMFALGPQAARSRGPTHAAASRIVNRKLLPRGDLRAVLC